MRIEVKDYSLILLIGVSSCGKTEFAEKHFFNYEINHTDDPDFTKTLQVMDGNWLEMDKRQAVLKQAKINHFRKVAIIFQFQPEELPHCDKTELQAMTNIERRINEEGFDEKYYFNSLKEMEEISLVRTKLPLDERSEHGPFDIIGDVHGCFGELTKLIRKLGYKQDENGKYHHEENRKLVFVGDVVDRGEASIPTLKLIMKLCRDDIAYMVLGNHDDRLLRYLKGNAVEVKHGLETTAAELEKEDEETKKDILSFLESLPAYYLFDDGKLACVHAGIKEEYLGKYTRSIKQFCLYGMTTGEINEMGMPVRLDWADGYKGDTVIVYGHTPYLYVYKRNNAYCVDTGCVFYNRLSALRYPEMTVVDVRKRKVK